MEEDNFKIDSRRIFSTTQRLVNLREFDLLLKKDLVGLDWEEEEEFDLLLKKELIDLDCKEDEKFEFFENYPFLYPAILEMERKSLEEMEPIPYNVEKKKLNKLRVVLGIQILALAASVVLSVTVHDKTSKVSEENIIEKEDSSLGR